MMPDSMLSGNLLINGGTFNQSVGKTQSSISFDRLASKASPRAFHLADSDPSHATCYTNTRTKILERIKSWALRKTEKEKYIMWLHGAAGGGKTAIARTIAKWCDEEEGILLGEFFFSRSDGVGDQLSTLAPTIAYRMAVHTLKDLKEAKLAISEAITRDPHIFAAPLSQQLKTLILEPFDVVAPCGILPYVIVLDGLDETLSAEDQQLVLDVVFQTLYQHNTGLRVLVCSRDEPAIVTAFNDPDSLLNAISATVSLNADADSDSDIRRFLEEKFSRIRKLLPHPPKEEWPTSANIDYLVSKSSGQFIFAATVEKYVGSPTHRHHAVKRLKHILDLASLPTPEDKKKHPFADLDALYSLILTTRDDVDMAVKAIAICLEYPKYFNTVTPQNLSEVLQVDLDETWAILVGLASLLDSNDISIRPFHASFGDFLFDSSRSNNLHRAVGSVVADILSAKLTLGRDPEELSYRSLYLLLTNASPSQDLRDIFNQMTLIDIFKRPPGKRPPGAYFLISILRLLESYILPNYYEDMKVYFDENFARFLPNGRWKRQIFLENKKSSPWRYKSESNNTARRIMQKEHESDSSDSMIPLLSVSDSSDDSDDDEDSSDESIEGDRITYRGDTAAGAKMGQFGPYHVSQIGPLSTSLMWDDINSRLNIKLLGPDSLQGLCDEAAFARANLPATMSNFLDKSKQAHSAVFCLEQVTSQGTKDVIRSAFATLLPDLLAHAEATAKLINTIETLLTANPAICKRLPPETMKSITSYLERVNSAKQSSTKVTVNAKPSERASSAAKSAPPSTSTMSSKHKPASKASSAPSRNKSTSTTAQARSSPNGQNSAGPKSGQRTFLTASSSTPSSSKAKSPSVAPYAPGNVTPARSKAAMNVSSSHPPGTKLSNQSGSPPNSNTVPRKGTQAGVEVPPSPEPQSVTKTSADHRPTLETTEVSSRQAKVSGQQHPSGPPQKGPNRPKKKGKGR
ncbi:hypothetical protein D9613_012527 [Agrocybe pediades]|uniref:Nephrocystin 3-like N-terminal domain-containing protein n=1 Tax=Agrocybe pediades TaxID=84607 RepID=A0A8H4QSS0_9AGAR|nr:hypothetical protein D9613_012527 [Agrocybe pediades]